MKSEINSFDVDLDGLRNLEHAISTCEFHQPFDNSIFTELAPLMETDHPRITISANNIDGRTYADLAISGTAVATVIYDDVDLHLQTHDHRDDESVPGLPRYVHWRNRIAKPVLSMPRLTDALSDILVAQRIASAIYLTGLLATPGPGNHSLVAILSAIGRKLGAESCALLCDPVNSNMFRSDIVFGLAAPQNRLYHNRKRDDFTDHVMSAFFQEARFSQWSSNFAFNITPASARSRLLDRPVLTALRDTMLDHDFHATVKHAKTSEVFQDL